MTARTLASPIVEYLYSVRGACVPDSKDPEAGQRLREAVREAYGKPGLVHNQTQLSAQSKVSRSVLDGWWAGTMPTTANMTKVAGALGVPAEHLWLRWLGFEPPEPGLVRIASEIRALRLAIQSAGGGDEQTRAAIAAVAAAQEDPPPEPAEDPPSEPVASARRRRPVS